MNMHGEYLPKEITKVCNTCKEEKSLSKFRRYKRKDGTFNHYVKCQLCCFRSSKRYKNLYVKRMPSLKNDEWFKVCSNCKLERKLTEFVKDNRSSFGFGAECKPCGRAKHLAKNPPKPMIIYRDTKICIKCDTEKPLSSFGKYKKKGGIIGYTAKCNGCKQSPTAKIRLYAPYQKDGVWIKYCCNCRTVKPLEDFTKKLKGYGYCKPCNSKKSSADWQKASEERKQKRREYGKKYSKLPSVRKIKREKMREKYHSDPEYRARSSSWYKNLSIEEQRELRKRYKYPYKHTEAAVKRDLAYRARKYNAPIVIRFSKTDIIKRDGLNCYLCGKLLTEKTATIDHLIPLSRSGNHKPENVKIACSFCNTSKKNKTLTEYKKWRGDYARFRAKISVL